MPLHFGPRYRRDLAGEQLGRPPPDYLAPGFIERRSIQRGYVLDFVLIADLLHVVCYLFKAAQAVEAEAERWPLYLRWLRCCWQGQAAEVVAHMESYQERMGRPPPGEQRAATEPRRLLAEALSYLRNNAKRMDYPGVVRKDCRRRAVWSNRWWASSMRG